MNNKDKLLHQSKVKPIQQIVEIIKTAADKGLTLSQALPEIMAFNPGWSGSNIKYRNRAGKWICGYSNQGYALQQALERKQKALDSADPTMAELLVAAEAFSVIIVTEHRNGAFHYDMLCDGFQCTLSDILDGLEWYKPEWVKINKAKKTPYREELDCISR